MRNLIRAISFMAVLGAASSAVALDVPPNDYPTETRADYVFGCMQVNGQSREVLQKCSCSIDAIAALLPFSDYEAAETIMSVRQKGGESVEVFDDPRIKVKVTNLRRAQVEAELRCF